MSFFTRVVAPNKYYFSVVAKVSNDLQRLEDMIELIDE
jgi:hypothetical protein